MTETVGLTLVGVALAATVIYIVLRYIIRLLRRWAVRSKPAWDDLLLDKRVQHRLALLGPALVAYWGSRLIEDDPSTWIELVQRVTTAVLMVVSAAAISALLSSVNRVYESKAISRDRPIEAYIQLAQILLYLVTIILAIAVLVAKSPWLFVTGMGAMTAVLMLIFRDTILSFVASVQLVQSDVVDEGDWIEMPEFHVDGIVTDVQLHTVTVQNFDKSIVTIPTYKLITQSFRNWRGMARSGVRRIKRSILIDVSSIRFLTDSEIQRLRQFEPIASYIEGKLSEITGEDESRGSRVLISDRRQLTNLGTFRAYIAEYLDRLDTVETDDALFVVRQLEADENGLPLQVYAYARTTELAVFEAIQADIFDHLFAIVGQFGLRVFQGPMVESPTELSGISIDASGAQ